MSWKKVKILDLVANTKYPIGDGDHGAIKPSNYLDSGVPYIRVADIGWDGSISRENMVYISKDINEKNPKSQLFPNDLIIAKTGATIGKVAIIPDDISIANTTSSIGKITFDKSKADPKFIMYYMRTEEFKRQMWAVSIKSAQPGFNIINLKNFIVPNPTLADQIKIVTVLSKAEKLIKQRKENIDLLDEFLKSTFLNMFGDPVRNEKQYKLITLGELGSWKSGGTPSRTKVSYFEGNIPWLTSGELDSMYVKDSKEKITEEAIRNSNTSLIEEGSILLGMYDTAALKSSITTKQVTCNQAIAFSKLNEQLCNTVYIYFNIQIGKEYFKRFQRGVRQQNMNLSMIRSLKIILPPLKFQNQFAAIVEKTEALKVQLKDNLIDLENLYGSLSQRAFKGKLDLTKLIVNYEIEGTKEEPENKRYKDPFEVDEETAKKQGKLFYKQWQKLHLIKPHKLYNNEEVVINWEWLSNRIKERYSDKHFSFEMLMNYVKKEKLIDTVNYYSSEELKANPTLNDDEDVKAFIHSAISNVLMDEEQQRKSNKFITLKQSFYNAEKENFQLNLHKDDFKLLKDKNAKQRSGIYFSVIKEQ